MGSRQAHDMQRLLKDIQFFHYITWLLVEDQKMSPHSLLNPQFHEG